MDSNPQVVDKVYLPDGEKRRRFPDPLGLHRYMTPECFEFCLRERGFIKNWYDSWWRVYDLALDRWAHDEGISIEYMQSLRIRHAKLYRRFIWRLTSEIFVKPGTPWKWIAPDPNPYQNYFGDCWCGCGRRCMWRCWQCNDFFAAYICGIRAHEWNPTTAYHDAWYQRCERCIPEEDYCVCGCNNFAEWICSQCRKGFTCNCGVASGCWNSAFKKADIFFSVKDKRRQPLNRRQTSLCVKCGGKSKSTCGANPNLKCNAICGDLDGTYYDHHKPPAPKCECKRAATHGNFAYN